MKELVKENSNYVKALGPKGDTQVYLSIKDFQKTMRNEEKLMPDLDFDRIRLSKKAQLNNFINLFKADQSSLKKVTTNLEDFVALNANNQK